MIRNVNFGRAQSGASAGNRARVFGAVALLMLWACGAEAGTVTVNVQEVQGTYSVRAELRTSAPPAVVWNVLSDYDHIDTFVTSMRASTSERRADGQLLVRQVAAVGVFPVHKTVHVDLEVIETPGHSIAFHDVLGRDFHAYAGAWDIGADSTATIVYYWLEASPKAFVPLVGRGMMSRGVRDLLTQVGSEIQRRAAIEGAPGSDREPGPPLHSSRGARSSSDHDRELALTGE